MPFPYFKVRFFGVSNATNLPFIKIPILEHNDSAYLIECVVSTIDVLSFFTDCDKLFQRYLLEIGSTPDDGSSKNIMDGLAIIAIATHNFLLFPPLKFSVSTSK